MRTSQEQNKKRKPRSQRSELGLIDQELKKVRIFVITSTSRDFYLVLAFKVKLSALKSAYRGKQALIKTKYALLLVKHAYYFIL